MHFTQYTCVHSFHAATHEALMQHEAQNVIPLGNILIGARGQDKTDWRDPANWFMATITNHQGLVLTAIMTPPHTIISHYTPQATKTAPKP